jgi:hypothetical protein
MIAMGLQERRSYRRLSYPDAKPPGRTIFGRRFLTLEPTHLRSRSWKSSALRWGLAIAGIYFYNTSSAFADQPMFSELRRSSPHMS